MLICHVCTRVFSSNLDTYCLYLVKYQMNTYIYVLNICVFWKKNYKSISRFWIFTCSMRKLLPPLNGFFIFYTIDLQVLSATFLLFIHFKIFISCHKESECLPFCIDHIFYPCTPHSITSSLREERFVGAYDSVDVCNHIGGAWRSTAGCPWLGYRKAKAQPWDHPAYHQNCFLSSALPLQRCLGLFFFSLVKLPMEISHYSYQIRRLLSCEWIKSVWLLLCHIYTISTLFLSHLPHISAQNSKNLHWICSMEIIT